MNERRTTRQAEKAKMAEDFLHSVLPMSEASVVDKQGLVLLGKKYWPYSYKDVSSDSEADAKLSSAFEDAAESDPERGSILLAMMALPEILILTLGSARWVDQGLPVIRLGHKRAAALMATSISEDNLEFVHPPFHAFFIEMPDGLLPLLDQKDYVKCTGVLVHAVEIAREIPRDDGSVVKPGKYWRWAALTGTNLTQWMLNRTTAELAGYENRGNDYEGIGFPLEGYDDRSTLLIGRLICAVCLMMSNPGDLKEKQEAVKNPGQKKASKDAPTYRVFIEGSPVTVDVRDAVRSYLMGERSSTPRVRVLVRGHFKMQPHGEGRKLRKLIWIEPYWSRGLEGDPILKRAHTLGDEHGD